MQLLKFSANNLIVMIVDDTQTALAGSGKVLRAISTDEGTAIATLYAAGNKNLIDDPSAGIRAETAAQTLARQPIPVQLTAQFAALATPARAALLGTAAAVLAAVENKDYAAANAVIAAAVNPGGSGLSSGQFTALQAALTAVLPTS